METHATVAFHNFEASDSLKALIDRQIARLSRHHPDITTVYVFVDAPQRHNTGGTWDVRIEVGVPGTELSVNNHPGRHSRKDRPEPAVRDAFRAAARQLDHWRALRTGAVKRHEEPPQGRITRIEAYERYGFLVTEEGRELWFSAAAVQDGVFGELRVGDAVTYVEGDQGLESPMATTVRPVDQPVNA